MTGPRLARRARLRWDAARQRWVLLWPERGLLLNDTATAIARRCDGTRSVERIVDELCGEWSAPRERVDADVRGFLSRVAARGLLEGA